MSPLRTGLAVLCLAIASGGFAIAPADAATFVLVKNDGPNEGFNDPNPKAPVAGNNGNTLGKQRTNAFQEAADTLGAIFKSNVVIRVQIEMNPIFCDSQSAVLGFAGPTQAFGNFPNAARANTWHVVALANSLAGSDLTSPKGTVNIVSVFNSAINGSPGCLGGLTWWFGDPALAPPGTIPFVTVVLHEIAHGLGFTSLVDDATGAKLQGFDDMYMVNLEDHSTGKKWPAMTNGQRVTSSKDNGDLHWVGSKVVANSGLLNSGRHPSGHVRMYAPNPFESGSSVSHFDTVLSPNELMEPLLTPTSANFLTTSLLQDIGWKLDLGPTAPCVPGTNRLCISDVGNDRRFQVDVSFSSSQGGGSSGLASAIALGPVGVTRGGLFSFFNKANPEMLVKVLNGCAINGNYWVFVSAVTTVGYTVTITDTDTGRTFVRGNVDGSTAAPVTDLKAFPCS